MSQSTKTLDVRVYFGGLNVLVVESGSLERDILVQVMTGFKTNTVSKCGTTDEAMSHFRRESVDLLIVGSLDGATDAYAFIRWVRQSTSKAIQTVPVILLTGHTQQDNVIRARDCGANFVVAKPITPQVLYGRVAWLARDPRAFIVSDKYVGPDRRFQSIGPPAGVAGRRKTDLSLTLGDSNEPNMSQDAIDAMLSGKGADL